MGRPNDRGPQRQSACVLYKGRGVFPIGMRAPSRAFGTMMTAKLPVFIAKKSCKDYTKAVFQRGRVMQYKKTQSKRIFSKSALDRAVASSTAIETGQSVAEIERRLSRSSVKHHQVTLASALRKK